MPPSGLMGELAKRQQGKSLAGREEAPPEDDDERIALSDDDDDGGKEQQQAARQPAPQKPRVTGPGMMMMPGMGAGLMGELAAKQKKRGE